MLRNRQPTEHVCACFLIVFDAGFHTIYGFEYFCSISREINAYPHKVLPQWALHIRSKHCIIKQFFIDFVFTFIVYAPFEYF